jgi:hypothetical protein
MTREKNSLTSEERDIVLFDCFHIMPLLDYRYEFKM